MKSFKEKLINKANSLGFFDLKIAKSEELNEEFTHFENWIDNNYNASMKWMENNPQKRKNPSEVLENCKSVIVLAYNYFTAYKYPQDLSGKGKISKYAWGDDYHDIILPKLKEIEAFIKDEFPDSLSKSYVDTGPILEKIWAAKAGIGWQGKNSLIISKTHGSYFFLGIILSTLKLEADTAIKEYCGTCTKCIVNCPTGAIIEDKVIDSNKCISFWTIEAKPEMKIPENITNNFNNWIYGCDICQDVCPWNKNLPKITDELKFFPRKNETYIEIEELLSMTKDEFNARFKNSPIKRTKLSGMQRNASQLQFDK